MKTKEQLSTPTGIRIGSLSDKNSLKSKLKKKADKTPLATWIVEQLKKLV